MSRLIPGEIKKATISPCGLYRYTLSRIDRTRGTGGALFIGCNPSTADAEEDDATIRRLRGFTTRWGLAGFTIVNACAYRATDSKELLRVADPVGPENITHIIRELDAMQCSVDPYVIPMWGGALPKKLLPHAWVILDVLLGRGIRVSTFGLTKDGQPKHPLMLPYETKLQGFYPRRPNGR